MSELVKYWIDCLTEMECHCGRPVAYGYDGDPTHHRGMCADCDATRCDAYPQECPHPRENPCTVLTDTTFGP